MSGVAIITGTTHGIGRVTARELARAGRTVVMLCRDLRAGREVRDRIIAGLPGAAAHVIRCDLASLASVREAADSIRTEYRDIDLLVNNAGTVCMRHRTSPDGFELTFATNHLGPFLLTALLLDRLTRRARIVNVASRIHLRGHMDFDLVTNPRARYRPTAAYAQSKLANVLHTLALARRLAFDGITVNCLHPGVVASNLLPPWLRLVKPLLSPGMLDVERGARTSVYLALAPEVAGTTGRYFDEHQRPAAVSSLAGSVELQEELWRRSAAWTGVAA